MPTFALSKLLKTYQKRVLIAETVSNTVSEGSFSPAVSDEVLNRMDFTVTFDRALSLDGYFCYSLSWVSFGDCSSNLFVKGW